MKHVDFWHSLEKASRVAIGLLLIAIGHIFAIKSLAAPVATNGIGTTSDGFTTMFTTAENATVAVEAYQRHLVLQVMAPLIAGSIGILYTAALLIYTRIFRLKPARSIPSIAVFAGILILVGSGGLSILQGPDAQSVGLFRLERENLTHSLHPIAP